jgi:hypothetical protein
MSTRRIFEHIEVVMRLQQQVLQGKIDEAVRTRDARIQRLEGEIEEYQKLLDLTYREKDNLLRDLEAIRGHSPNVPEVTTMAYSEMSTTIPNEHQ